MADRKLELRRRIPRAPSPEVTQEFLEPSLSSTVNYRDGEPN
jgi:hypothetical protein